jgi:hypothetical protein
MDDDDIVAGNTRQRIVDEFMAQELDVGVP